MGGFDHSVEALLSMRTSIPKARALGRESPEPISIVCHREPHEPFLAPSFEVDEQQQPMDLIQYDRHHARRRPQPVRIAYLKAITNQRTQLIGFHVCECVRH